MPDNKNQAQLFDDYGSDVLDDSTVVDSIPVYDGDDVVQLTVSIPTLDEGESKSCILSIEKENGKYHASAEQYNASGNLVAVATYDEDTQITTLDKTAGEIITAYNAGQVILIYFGTFPIDTENPSSNECYMNFVQNVIYDADNSAWAIVTDSPTYSAATLDDYPTNP